MGRPRMRLYRAMQSCSVTNMAWPMCSLPVTFGGGLHLARVKRSWAEVGACVLPVGRAGYPVLLQQPWAR